MLSMLTHRTVRRYTSLAAAAGTLAAMILLSAGPAQAAGTAPGTGQAVRSVAAAQHLPARQAARVRQARPAKAGKAKKGTPDTRRACPAPKPGHASCLALVRTNVPARKGMFPAGTAPSGYGPADLQSAYNLPSATAGSGATVAVVDAYDDPTAEADLQVYRAQYGLPVCDTANGCFEKVNEEGQQGNYPPPDPGGSGSFGWATEEALDLDMVSATCPNCHILLVEANSDANTYLYEAEDEAVALGAKYVSNSWGVDEFPTELHNDRFFNHPGVAITAAAGDLGYGESASRPGGVQYPAASQYVTAVGGTTLTRDSSAPRGWQETAWDGEGGNFLIGDASGPGCSAYEPKPAWQADTGCGNRTVADVSAVADPETGVAVYDTSDAFGWEVTGGTSVGAPIIASVYALAGTPSAASYPASYPYAVHSALYDVTSGTDGTTCNPAYLCTAGPGYDAPTGWGTPDGAAAFSSGPHGDITGQVTSKATGNPVAGATVSTAQGYAATTDAQGDYDLAIPVGSYDLTVQDFGYRSQAATGVTVSSGQDTTEDFALPAIPRRTLSGTVTDGSGHKWPLYAKISISGDPGSPFYTNPYTGAYSVSLPQHASYQLQVTPVSMPGYQANNLSVHIGTAGKQKNVRLTVDQTTCTAPGYGYNTHGTLETFTGWSGTTPQDGWTVTDNNNSGNSWNFSDPQGEGNQTGGSGTFAIADSRHATSAQDTSLISPVENLSGWSAPQLRFYTDYSASYGSGETADVDLSLDGGQTWSTVWQQTNSSASGLIDIPIPQAAGQSAVQVRFHYTNAAIGTTGGVYWEVDNVSLDTCAAARGGLVAGQVTDHNTGNPVDDAAVASVANPAETATTAAAPGTGDGFYELFAAGTGGQQFTATATTVGGNSYAPDTETVNVAPRAVTRQDFSLQAGNLAITPGSVSATVGMGNSVSRKVTFTNDGTEPMRVMLGEQDDGFTPMGGQADARTAGGAPLQRIKAHVRLGAMKPRPRPATGRKPGIQLRQPVPYDPPWAGIADYPVAIGGNAVAYDSADGDVYSVAGYAGAYGVPITAGFVYDPASQQWSQIANAPVDAQEAGAAFVGGILYLIGGWNVQGVPTSSVYAYNPVTNTWSPVPSMPGVTAAAGVAVLDGQIYVVGGCAGDCGPATASVYRYDPGSNSWTRLADYPGAPVAAEACAGISGQIVCAGGLNVKEYGQQTPSMSTYRYNPHTNTWSQGADMPYTSWAAAYAGANGKLQVVAGVSNGAVSNQAVQYDPATNTWSSLPNAGNAEYEGGGACGIYQVGGYDSAGGAQASAEVLPGYDQCGTQDVPWLSESSTGFELTPGQSVTVTVTLDSSVLSQPGTYTSGLAITTNTPYQFQPVGITLQVKPPKSWGKITGTVTDATTGKPIFGATVQICTLYRTSTGSCGPVTYTLGTDSNGSYQLWLDHGYSPLQVIAAKNGYQQQVRIVKITKGATTTVNFALQENSSSSVSRQKAGRRAQG